ncbi:MULTISPECIES: hypothetical protein [Leptolyngbya]|jgi:hypothetical protein|uniref:Uncharacterized protein n=2 Tax=Leptolyngbya boryana TaxID=1184 RepID=A0A1Z4JJH1_LEPBY|nr:MULTISPECIES: hypothetical protein [Leptolyngbya]BAY56707.1 hypothetical protein NIES2135_35430 [Leptolyngbya boryana NIES-2135]MBD1857996.1 hypothetical protein [Leptolyngbya sp. FACHB-1624]MBD2369456.1 hypothetical protein [Leptolyngbya sp. FACHB-161]MBD2376799.1 hypothetical protein [Leptolyngbya sp. FACHB-238]MBD2401166.1 hypothetical protein [Leptolyngbya sp. FACHB-239]
MVQERDLRPRKMQESDLDRPLGDRPIPPMRHENSGTPLSDILSGLALLISLIAFFLSAYAVIQVRRQSSVQPQSSNPSVSRPLLPFLSQPQQVTQGQFIQPTEDRSAQVELLSATRGSSNSATIQLQVRRLDRPVTAAPTINLANAIALNSRTNEQYPVIQTPASNNQFISLSNLRPGSSLNTSVTLRVPDTLDRIDLDIPNVRVFRNVPISIS